MMMFEGYQWREDRQMEMLAFFTCQLLNVSGKVLKRNMTVNDLLGRKAKGRDKAKDEAELKEMFKHRLQGGGG